MEGREEEVWDGGEESIHTGHVFVNCQTSKSSLGTTIRTSLFAKLYYHQTSLSIRAFTHAPSKRFNFKLKGIKEITDFYLSIIIMFIVWSYIYARYIKLLYINIYYGHVLYIYKKHYGHVYMH